MRDICRTPHSVNLARRLRRGAAVSAALTALLWCSPANAAVGAATTTFFGSAGATLGSQSHTINMALTAGRGDGTCTDATSGTTIGTACALQVVGNFAVDATCTGSGPALLRYFPSSGNPYVYNIYGTLTLVGGRSGSFAGSLLMAGAGQVAFANVHYLLQRDGCSGASGSMAGSFYYAAAA